MSPRSRAPKPSALELTKAQRVGAHHLELVRLWADELKKYATEELDAAGISRRDAVVVLEDLGENGVGMFRVRREHFEDQFEWGIRQLEENLTAMTDDDFVVVVTSKAGASGLTFLHAMNGQGEDRNSVEP